MSDEPQRPTTNDRAAWRAYWTVLGMPWRTEPEIDEARQAYLAERRAVKPDIERGIYPFRDESGNIKLTRADVEWLLATHDDPTPPEWDLRRRDERVGLDLRGVDLRRADLNGLPLVNLRGTTTEKGVVATHSRAIRGGSGAFRGNQPGGCEPARCQPYSRAP